MAGQLRVSPDVTLNQSSPCFIIAEIGQNHQGDIRIAKKLIDAAKEAGADCVKFQKSSLTEKFNASALRRPYAGPHSWGKTYGEHKAFLEFSVEDMRELQKYAHNQDLIFTASAMDWVSLDVLESLDVPFFKIGSGDANNFPLLEYAAGKGRPLVISTGMQNMDTVNDIYHLMKKRGANFCLLHCVSSYPVPPEQVNLEVINTYKSEFSDILIGYSGHELGITISIAAVAMGAKVLERHMTLDRAWKGSDHCCSLTPPEFGALVREVRLLERALGCGLKRRQPSERACYDKLGKTAVAARALRRGTALQPADVRIKVAEPRGWPAESLQQLLGRTLRRDLARDESICAADVD